MKFQWASGLLLGAAVNYVDASHIPFATDSSHIVPPTKGPIDPEAYVWQAKPHGGSVLKRSEFSVECSSVSEGSKCDSVKDGLAETHWTSYNSTQVQNNSIIIDLHSIRNVNGLSMRPLLSKLERGQIAKHEVQVSTDKSNWKQVAYGTWGWNKSTKLSIFETEPAQYVKLVAMTEAPPTRSPNDKYSSTVIQVVDINIYTSLSTVPEDPSKGTWGPTLDLPIVAAAGAHAASGNGNHNIILWSAWSNDQFFASPGGETFTTTWDPSKKDIIETNVTNTYHDMFCPGISMDTDGKIVVSGGADSDKTSVFNGTHWNAAGDMKLHRGYHSTTTLSDGRIFAIGGSWSGGSNTPKDGEVYDPKTTNWTRLPDIKADVIHTNDIPLRNDNHAWLFGWKNGSVFHAGPSINMFWFDTQGTGNVKSASRRLNDGHSTSGNAVMFDAVNGKILTFGGQEYYDGSFGSRNAHLITIGNPYKRPKVKVAGVNGTNGVSGAGGMYNQRVYHTSVVLPDGTVFIAGGEIYGSPFNEAERDIQLTPEIYYPEYDLFVPLKKNNIVRVYHSLSILLPDATVLNGGGGLCGNCTVNHYDAQIFTPPYLLKPNGDRAVRPSTPLVADSDYRVEVGKTLEFTTDAGITNASLIRLGTVSHTVNTDQRRIPLTIIPASSAKSGLVSYEAKIPSDAGVALPGYYMLFVMNSAGVPSEAATIKVELPTTPSSGKHVSYEQDDEEEEEEEEEEKEKDCDMDKDDQGMVDVVVAATRKLLNTQKSGLVRQG